MTLSFFVPGDPKGQPRTKATAFGGHARVYTPKTADDWKGNIMREAQEAKEKTGWTHERGQAVTVELIFGFRRPANHLGKRGLKPSAPKCYTGKPDADNAAKAVLDALVDCGILFDDAPVAELFVIKSWAEENGFCGVSIQIEHMEDRE